MKITNVNSSYLNYSIFDDRIDIDNIKSYKKGDGSEMLNELKRISRNLNLPIELYSEPQDDTISQSELNDFYRKNGFELHHDDVDNSYFIFK